MNILNKKISAFIVLFFIFSISIILSLYVYAILPPEEIGCGDGTCRAYDGEDGCTCPDDCPVGCTPTPTSGGTIGVKIDNPENEFWQFYLGGGSGCGIEVTEEDGWLGREDRCSTGANNNIILNHNYGALSDTGAYCGNCGDNPGDCPQDILWRSWGPMSKSKCGDCSLSSSNSYYRPKGDLLCSGKWYLCDSSFHQGNNRAFRVGGQNYICTTSNDWVIASGICSNKASTCDFGCCQPPDSSEPLQCSNNHCCGSDEKWSDSDGKCIPTGECNPGQTQTRFDLSCGNKCGVQHQTCSSLRQWVDDYCVNEGQCSYSNGDFQTQSCTSGSGTERKTCTSLCQWPGTWDTSGCISSCQSGQTLCGSSCTNNCASSFCDSNPCDGCTNQCPIPGSFTLSGSCSGGSNPRVGLSWSSSSNANSYEVYARQWSTGSWNLKTSTSSRSYTDSPPSNVDMYYEVEAINNAGRSSSNTYAIHTSPSNCGSVGPCNGNPPSKYGQSCNCNPSCPSNCGGTIQCNGACSGSMPSCGCAQNQGQSCNSCGGTIQCDGSCSPICGRCTVSVTNSPSNNACWTVSGGGENKYRCGSTSVDMPAGTVYGNLDFNYIPSGYTYAGVDASSNYPNCPAGGTMSFTWNFQASTPCTVTVSSSGGHACWTLGTPDGQRIRQCDSATYNGPKGHYDGWLDFSSLAPGCTYQRADNVLQDCNNDGDRIGWTWIINCNTQECNNGVREGNEQCDGSNLNGQTCQSRGYDGGTLRCTKNCAFDESGCTKISCGNGIKEGNEQCDDGANNGACPKACSASCTINRCETPTLYVSKSSYSFTATQGSSNPPADTLTITNAGNGLLSWSVSDNAAWLTVQRNFPGSETNGIEGSGGSSTPPLSVLASTSSLAVGTYTATISVSSNGGSASIPVTLTISQQCTGTGTVNVNAPGHCYYVKRPDGGEFGECNTKSFSGYAAGPYSIRTDDPGCCPNPSSGNLCPPGSVSLGIVCGSSCGGPGCPDGSCNGGETCSSCPSDCGACQECTPDTWVPTGSSCGNCGRETQYCRDDGTWSASEYGCDNQGPCRAGSTQCLGTSYYSCGSSCHWSQHIGTDNDGDGVDRECGDSQCDNAYGVTDSTKQSTETSCADSLDNDCDGRRDCQDTDCAGRQGPGGVTCCQTVSNCPQDDCVIESCVANNCQFANRNNCDSTECASGRYCYNGDCTDGDNSEYVCLNCAPDTTTGRWDWSAKIFEDAGKTYSRNTNVFDKLFDSNEGACSGSTCTKTGGCGCYDALSTITLIKRKQALTTGNCCGDDPNEWYKKDYYGGECVSSVEQCVWSDGHAQPGNSGNRQWWCNPGNWYECTDDTIGQGSPANPPPQGVCCAGTIGNNGWTPVSEVLTENQYSCSDGKDNDCDGKTDCEDNDCDGTLKGTVRSSESGQPIWQADIAAKKALVNFKSASTNQQGTYSMVINCGTYNVVASHPDYGPETKGNLIILPNQDVTADFTLTIGSSCEDDCTFVADDLVHASCDNKNGCKFYNDKAKSVCDLSHPGWIRDYDNDNYIVCAEGTPKPKVEVEASVSCSSGTLVKVTRIAYYNGKPVKLVVAACG